MTTVAAKRYACVQKHLEFFQTCILTLLIGTVFWGGGGGGGGVVLNSQSQNKHESENGRRKRL